MRFTIYTKNTLQKIVLLILSMQLATTPFCQDNLASIATSFNQYNQHTSVEKLFVHTDKNFYLSGEILWFKMYVADVTFHKPIDISKVAYAEILDTANRPVLQAKI